MHTRKKPSKKFSAIGMMSGTSLDGMDLVFCEFESYDNEYSFQLILGETIPYAPDWQLKLSTATSLNGSDLMALHHAYGKLTGENINRFLKRNNIPQEVNFIAMHGHTVFHEPKAGYTFQLGDANDVAALTQTKVVADFRGLDMALGGRGAPLVPVGDLFLFPEYTYCLNLGGIANISIQQEGGDMIGFDICGCNILLDRLANVEGMPFDEYGYMAGKGNVIRSLLRELVNCRMETFLNKQSLSKEMILENEWEILKNSGASTEDKLATVCEYIVAMIKNSIPSKSQKRMLITGGGAFNKTLINRLNNTIEVEIVLPSKHLIQFREALIFAFLGLRRLENKYNCLSSVTGAKRNSAGGCIYLP
jgi:anhydro-N-acetylmuramic acid kinase